MKKRTIIYVIGILLLIGAITTAFYIYQSNNTSANNVEQSQQEVLGTTNSKGDFTYKGKDGVTALALLQQAAKTGLTGTGENAYVTTINGVTASKNQFWELFVNDKSSLVGAGSYTTKNSDTITWKLSSF